MKILKWTKEDQLLAHASGWGIFSHDGGPCIQRIDDPESVGMNYEPLESDEAACALVVDAAMSGDLHAQKAIDYIFSKIEGHKMFGVM